MLKAIRNIKLGYVIMLIGLGAIVSGISMTESNGGKTLLCFDEGCIYIQGISNIAVGIFCIGLGVYMMLRT